MSKPILGIIESLFENVKGYMDDRLELFKLKLVQKVSAVVSSVISFIVLMVVFLIFFTVFNIGIALLISEFTGKAYAGFLILAGFYAIAGIVLFIGSGRFLTSAISSIIIRKIYKHAGQKNK